jgi:hypothetical protein
MTRTNALTRTLMALAMAFVGTVAMAAGDASAAHATPAAERAPGDSFGVVGTPGNDLVLIDDRAGRIYVNNILFATFDGTLDNQFTVDTLNGDDTVQIYDGQGRDRYVVKTRSGDDEVDMWDGGASDTYDIDTGIGVEGPGIPSNDTVWIKDGPNDHHRIQKYQIRTDRGHDRVTIRDSSKGQTSNPKVNNYDLYDVDTWCEDDMVEITDARFVDLYSLLADGACADNPFDYDTLNIEDPFVDPDNAGWSGFEAVVGKFI